MEYVVFAAGCLIGFAAGVIATAAFIGWIDYLCSPGNDEKTGVWDEP